MGQMHDKIGFSYSWVQSSGFNPFESKEVENLLKKGMRLVWELVDWLDSCMAGRRVMVGCCSVSRPASPRAAAAAAAAAAALINETPTHPPALLLTQDPHQNSWYRMKISEHVRLLSPNDTTLNAKP